MKKRLLRFESLEERELLAVTAGLEPPVSAPLPAPTEAAPAGYAVGDVYIASTFDADGDGFIGPAEMSYMSYAWFSMDGQENWNPASDLDGDGFIGPGDHAYISSNWFKTNDALPDSTKSYRIYPSDISNWSLFGDQVSKISARSGSLTLDARSCDLEAVCDFGGFASDLRVTCDFKTTGSSTSFLTGLELAVQESGARYYAEIQKDRVCLYYVNSSGRMSLLDGAFYTFASNRTYTVWAQRSGNQFAFGIGGDTLVAVTDSHLTGGQVGFYAADGVNVFSNISVTNNPEKAASPVNRVGDVIITTKFAENGVPLAEPITTCRISPSDTSNWFLFGDKISKVTARNGILNIDATSGALEAVCDYEGFEDDIRVSADFRGSGAFNAGIELAVQPSGARYYAEIRGDAVSLYYIDEGENFTLLHSVGCTFAAGKSYSVWMHLTDGQLACGVGGETLIAMTETRVSGGYVGFYAASGIGAFSNISVTFNPEKVANTIADLPAAGKQFLYTSPSTGLVCQLYLPTDLSAQNKNGLPLLIYLHGASERGNPEKIKLHGPSKLIEIGWADSWPFITLSPNCPAGTTWSTSQLLKLFDEVADWLPVDKNRIYVTGCSMGGHGTWNVLLAAPDKFAAGVPVCGWSDPSRASALVDIPIWIRHGAADTGVNPQRSRDMYNAITAAGGTKVILTLFPGVGHDCWDEAYDTWELYNWLLQQSK